MIISLLFRLMRTYIFVPWCTGQLCQIWLIVVTIEHFLFVLHQPILIGWDWIVAFNKLLCEENYFLIVSLMGMKICLMWCVLTCGGVLLACEHLTVVVFILEFLFQVRIHISGSCLWFVIWLDVAWHVVMSWRILSRSHVNHIGTWLNQSHFSSCFEFKWITNRKQYKQNNKNCFACNFWCISLIFIIFGFLNLSWNK